MNLKNYFKLFLSSFDLFKINMVIFFNSKSMRTTWLGIFLSFFLFGLLIASFTQSDFIQKVSPYVISEETNTLHASRKLFNEDHFISISVSDNDNVNYYDPSIFSIIFTVYHYKINTHGAYELQTAKIHETHVCNATNMGKNAALFEELGLENARCLDNPEFFIEGYWDEPEIYYAEASLFLCENISSNNSCKSYEEMQKFFDHNVYFQIVAYGVNVKFNEYRNPLVKQYQLVFQIVDLQIYKEMNVNFKALTVSTEEGFLFSSKRNNEDFVFSKSNVDFQVRNRDSSLIADIILYSSHEKTTHTRRYQTISEVLASLSGTANFFMIFCFWLTNMKNYLNTMTKILNTLYSFPRINRKKYGEVCYEKENSWKLKKIREIKEELKENKENFKEKKGDILMKNYGEKQENNPFMFIPSKQLSKDSFILPHYSQEVIEKNSINFKKYNQNSENKSTIFERNSLKSHFFSILSKIVPFSQKKYSKTDDFQLKIGIFEYLKYWFKRFCKVKKNNKEKWIAKSEKIFKEELDIITILSKIKELEKLKLLVLNEDQLILFESLTKPMVFPEKDKISCKYEAQPSIKMTNIIKTYKNIDKSKFLLALNNVKQKISKNEKNNDNLDYRLLNLIE